MERTKAWCITINNYDEEDLSRLRKLSDEEICSYLVFQEEIGETTKTPHIQGYVVFNKGLRRTAVKKLVGDRANLTVPRGSSLQNRTYCLKKKTSVPGTQQEFGELPPSPPNQGKRNDIRAFQEAVRLAQGQLTYKEALEDHPSVCARCPRFVREYMDLYRIMPPIPSHELRLWQSDLEDLLTVPPGDREIIFVVDIDGNAGKTWFAKRYCRAHENTQYMEPGKKADMAFLLQETTRVLFINVTRQQVDHLQYSFLEAVKDGIVFSPKYESGMKHLSPVHVVVLLNQEPDKSMLSDDRYHIIYI